MITPSEAKLILKMCSEGKTHAEQADILGVPVVRVSQAVTKMRAAGFDVPNARAVREAFMRPIREKQEREEAKRLAEARAEREAKQRAARNFAVVGSDSNETPGERYERIAEMYRAGASIVVIAAAEGVGASRIYDILRRYNKRHQREGLAAAKRIDKSLAERAKANERREKRAMRSRRATLKLGLKP